MEVDTGVFGRTDELAPVLPPVYDRQFTRYGYL